LTALVLLLGMTCAAAPPPAVPGEGGHWALVRVDAGAGPPLGLPAQAEGDVADWITVRADTTGKSVRWVSLDAGLSLFPPRLLSDPKTAVVTARAPGRYRLLCVACLADELSEPAVCTVVIGPPAAPAPTPPPQGSPPPAAPRAGGAHVVVIEETAQASSARGAYLASADLAAYLRARGWRMRWADRDARDAGGKAPADLAPYLARARGRTLPYLCVVDEHGNVWHEGALPATPAGLLALLKRIGG
jgi:hypothetical protein